MRLRQYAAVGLLGRGAVTRGEALDARGVVRDFLGALAWISGPIGVAARDGAKEVTELAVQLSRLRPIVRTRGARWGSTRKGGR